LIKSGRIRLAGQVANIGGKRNAHRIFTEEPEENIQQGRPIRRWEDNAKMDIRDIGWDVMEWINVAHVSPFAI
jgi:hypothetical protein